MANAMGVHRGRGGRACREVMGGKEVVSWACGDGPVSPYHGKACIHTHGKRRVHTCEVASHVDEAAVHSEVTRKYHARCRE